MIDRFNPVKKYFEFEIIQVYRCKNCKLETRTVKSDQMHYCEVTPDSSSLNELLITSFQYDIEKRCECSVHNTKFTCRLGFKKLPKLFVVGLKRAIFDKKTIKLKTEIKLSHLLKLATTNKEKKIYKLNAVVNHIGESPTSGHYIGFFYRRFNKNWFRVNDGVVNQCDLSDVFEESKNNGYLFVYRQA